MSEQVVNEPPLRVAYITSGAAGMYCGSCLHDNTLARALTARGVDVQLIPTYTPIRTDEEDVSIDRVFLGGINVFLQEKLPLFRHLPEWLSLQQITATGNYTGTGGLLNVLATTSTAGTLANFTNNTSTYTGTIFNLSATGITSGKALEISVGNGVTTAGANTGSFFNITGPTTGTSLTGIGVGVSSFLGAGGTLQELKPTFAGASGTATGLKLSITDSTTSTAGFNIIDISAFSSQN